MMDRVVIAALLLSSGSLSASPAHPAEAHKPELLRIDGGTVFKNGSGYVLKPVVQSDACYDIATESEAVRRALGRIERNTDFNVLPFDYTGRPFSVILKRDIRLSIHEGSYFLTEDGYIGISSAAFYIKDDKQTFLACPTRPGPKWSVFQVISIEFH